MRTLVLATLLVSSIVPAGAQTFTPLSGPNTPVPSPICDIINFGFCPQPPSPPPVLPDPEADASPAPRPLPPPAAHRRMRHHRRHLAE